MRILLVEDDEEKRKEVNDFLEEKLEASIDFRMSFQSGKKAIKELDFDLILLDMDMPTFDISYNETGGRKQAFGGKLLLHEMARRNINTKVIVITQFDYFENSDDGLTLTELDSQLKLDFSNIYLGSVQLKGGSEDWKKNLLNKINSI